MRGAPRPGAGGRCSLLGDDHGLNWLFAAATKMADSGEASALVTAHCFLWSI